MELKSVLLGASLGILGVIGTGFLKKAGEDCYALVKRNIFPKAMETHSPQLVIQLNRDINEPAFNYDSSALLEPTSVEHVSQLTFDKIYESIDDAPPLQRKSIQDSYVGIRVEWDTHFLNGSVSDDGVLQLYLSAGKRLNMVLCKVPLEEYPEFKILKKDSKIRVSGKISIVRSGHIELSEVRLNVFNQ